MFQNKGRILSLLRLRFLKFISLAMIYILRCVPHLPHRQNEVLSFQKWMLSSHDMEVERMPDIRSSCKTCDWDMRKEG